MNNTTNPSGLMSVSPSERSELLKLIHNAFGPAPTKPRSLEERLASLTEAELQQVMQWAKFVKMSQNFGKANQAKSYAQLTHEMYGKFDNDRKALIADLLQEADPVEAIGYTPPKATVSYNDDGLSEWTTSTIQPAPSLAAETKPNRATPAGPYADKAQFIAAITPAAEAAAAKLNIDPKIIIAQSALETGWGRSVKGNSYFGIKAHGSDKTVSFDTHEEDATGLMRKQKDSFRAYDNLEASVAGYADFLASNPRYKPMLKAETTEEQISALGESGYATDSKYGEKIRSIVKGLGT
jgi:flagellum-specific peptidoglycan hydrolase FlgJ